MNGAVLAINSALSFTTFARWELEAGYGGTFSTNAGVDYTSRVDVREQAALDRVAPGVAARALAALARGPRVGASPAARAQVDRQLTPTGALDRPLVTLHDAVDPVAPVEHEAAYAAQVAGQGREGDLLQLVSSPPTDWTGAAPPYGSGHCRFTEDELFGMLTVLNDWVTTGRRPDPDAVRLAFGPDTGLDFGFAVPPWPGAR